MNYCIVVGLNCLVSYCSGYVFQQKRKLLDLMVSQIVNFCQNISRMTIVCNSKSIKTYGIPFVYTGFQFTGSHFIGFDDMSLKPNERSEDLLNGSPFHVRQSSEEEWQDHSEW